MLCLAIATTLIAATVSGKSTSTGIAEGSRLENPQEEHYEKEKREWDGNRSTDTGGLYPNQESSADELADAVSHRDVGYQDTGNAVNEKPQQSIAGGWQDTVPGISGMDYPNLERVPVTSFTCADKEPGGYYADAETGCQVFHVCNTGGVKSSFLCPPGSIFNQKYFVCDWWYSFNCDEAVGLYFKKLNDNLEPEKQEPTCADYGESRNCSRVYENFEIDVGFESLAGKHPEDVRITNGNLANDLSLASGGHGVINYYNGEARVTDRQPSNIKQNNINVVNDSKKAEEQSNNEKKPRGFSHSEHKIYRFMKFDETRLPDVTSDATNNLASHVNYAYFEAGLNIDNNDDNENIQYDNLDENETKEILDNDKNFGDKYVYGEKLISGYSSSDDKYDSSERIEEV